MPLLLHTYPASPPKKTHAARYHIPHQQQEISNSPPFNLQFTQIQSTRTLQPHKTNKRWSFDCLPFRTELDTHIHQELITSLGNSIVLRKLNSQLPGFLLLYWEDATRYNQSSLAHWPHAPSIHHRKFTPGTKGGREDVVSHDSKAVTALNAPMFPFKIWMFPLGFP